MKLYQLEGVKEPRPVFVLERDQEPTTAKQATEETSYIHTTLPWRATLVWQGHEFTRDAPGPRRCWKCHSEYNANYKFDIYPVCRAAEISGLSGPAEAR